MDEGHENIRYAIIERAIEDYKNALQSNDNAKITTLEHWFLSEWGQQLSGGNGQYIIEKVKQEMKGTGNDIFRTDQRGIGKRNKK